MKNETGTGCSPVPVSCERRRNRTFNLWIKSPLLCQLSYAPEPEGAAYLACPPDAVKRPPKMARPEGVEPPTRGLEGRCSVQLSYGRESLLQKGG